MNLMKPTGREELFKVDKSSSEPIVISKVDILDLKSITTKKYPSIDTRYEENDRLYPMFKNSHPETTTEENFNGYRNTNISKFYSINDKQKNKNCTCNYEQYFELVSNNLNNIATLELENAALSNEIKNLERKNNNVSLTLNNLEQQNDFLMKNLKLVKSENENLTSYLNRTSLNNDSKMYKELSEYMVNNFEKIAGNSNKLLVVTGSYLYEYRRENIFSVLQRVLRIIDTSNVLNDIFNIRIINNGFTFEVKHFESKLNILFNAKNRLKSSSLKIFGCGDIGIRNKSRICRTYLELGNKVVRILNIKLI